MPLLEIRNLTAGYGDAVVIDDLSLAVEENEGLAVLGRNGVGKSTLLLSVVGHTRQIGGRILWQGRDISSLPVSARSTLGIGWVPQERNIFASLTVEENLRVAAAPGRYDLARVYGLFPRLRERRRNMGDKLSGGEQQMLAIGRTLMTNPRLLLLDEPFEGLAPVIVEELIRALTLMLSERRMAIVLVEQHTELALELTEAAVVLERGQIVHRAPSAELARDAATLERLVGLRVAATA